jgi:thiopeptide-type bacteriocin biosynthesis protein
VPKELALPAMKGNSVRELTTSGFFVLRTPLLPFEEFLALSEGLAFPQALRHGGDLASSAAADHKLICARLLKLLEQPEIREALWLASPEFSESLSTWKNEPESAKGQKLERALYRYVARMTSRPTPFGLFAGCSLGRIDAETRLHLGPRSDYWRRSRLDMEYLCNLAEKISSDACQQRQLYFRTNTSLYLAAGRYHHAQSYIANDVRCYRLIATDPTPYLTATLERASSGATPAELVLALVKDDPEIDNQEAGKFVRQLIESQILVSELTPPITGPEPLEYMLAQLERAQQFPVSATLKSVSERLHSLDDHGLGNHLAGYQEIVSAVSQLPCEFKLDHLVQVDMMKKPAQATVDRRLVRDILRGVETLHSLVTPLPVDTLEQFKQDFWERYQEQEVPLVLALDDEVGIGFERRDNPDASAEPLIENMEFSSADDESEVKARKPEFILLRKLEELAQEKKTSLELDANLLEALRARNPPPLPDAFAAIVQIISPADARAGKLSLYLPGVTGPSGALLLGRFCPADDQLTACVREHLRSEEENRAGENVIYAEVIHLPEGRVGNVLCRPMLRDYEIPFLATSRAPRDRQILVSDLMVSVRNDRIVLRSQRLGCEVVPRLTSAHGYLHGRNLKLYKFLCLLQTQGLSGVLGWNWGFLEEAAFLPRVTFGNIVFAPARWRMDQETIEDLAREPGAQRLRRIDEWRSSKQIPRFALLVEADNQLLVDFENVLSMETLIEYIKNWPSAQLVEMLTAPGSLYASGPEGTFTHELVVPFVRVKPQAAPTREAGALEPSRASPTPAAAHVFHTERNFLPGSEWLFAKIYAGPSHLDRLLVEHIRPLVAKVLVSGWVNSWFFIRYGDPSWHLRLRFHGMPRTLSAEVLPQLWECLELQKQQGKIWRMQLDTYEPELERYGGLTGMRIAERLFQYDSEFVLELLAAICDQLGTNIRWHLAFAGVDCLLDGLGLDLSSRRRLVSNRARAQEKNFRVNQIFKTQLSEKFRNERQILEVLLESSAETGDFPASAQAALARFAGQMKIIRAELETASRTGELAQPIEELAGSYIHMHLNRMFRSSANAQEMVLYDFLARAYDSKMARPVK